MAAEDYSTERHAAHLLVSAAEAVQYLTSFEGRSRNRRDALCSHDLLPFEWLFFCNKGIG
jgi:hypothetical protein